MAPKSPSPETILDLEAIDRDLMREAFDKLAMIDQEMDGLRLRLKVARAVERPDLEEVLSRVVDDRTARRELLSQFVALAPKPKEITPQPAPEVSRAEERVPVVVPPLAVEIAKTVPPAPAIKPPEKKTPTLSRSAFDKRCKQFFTSERSFLEEKLWNDMRECRTKALVCEARALIEAARELDHDPSNLWTSFNLLRDLFNENTDADFFGFNTARVHRVEVWSGLAGAFDLVPTADECLTWLEAHEVEPGTNEQLIIGCAAVESWIHRICDEAGIVAVDVHQKRLHSRISAACGDTWIPWWKKGAEGEPTATVQKAAMDLLQLYRQTKDKVERANARGKSMDALRKLGEAMLAPGEIEQTLYPAILECLRSGIPPSNKELVYACHPFRQVLVDLEDPTLGKLIEYVDKHATQMFAKFKALPEIDMEPDDPEDEDYAELLEQVRARVSGKRVLFVGGKSQKQRVAELKKELNAGEVVWPDSEPDTNAESFLNEARKADIVCFVVKWSRHSYKRVIDFAKGEGKGVVTLKAGVGPRRIVHDLHQQLVK